MTTAGMERIMTHEKNRDLIGGEMSHVHTVHTRRYICRLTRVNNTYSSFINIRSILRGDQRVDRDYVCYYSQKMLSQTRGAYLNECHDYAYGAPAQSQPGTWHMHAEGTNY